MTTAFDDHFSRFADSYARHRPQAPPELFAYLAGLAPGRGLAWDCGTGNGQAALALAGHFDRVYASDASAEQVARARPHPKVEYRVEPAEQVSLRSGSVDLVTVAVAVHWFDFDRFYAEVRRVLGPGGIIAVWAYHLPAIAPEIERILADYYQRVVGRYWPERFRYVDEQYRTLPFPFHDIEPPPFAMTAEWSLEQLGGFLDTWSATRRFQEQEGRHPLEEVWPALRGAWGEAHRTRPIRWPLHLRVGRRSEEDVA